MKYDLSKHSLIEDNGELIALFAPNFRADKAFEIADKINDWKNIPELEDNIECLIQEKDEINNDFSLYKDKVQKTMEENERLEEKLQEIINIIEFKDYTISESDLQDIINICSSK